ncbi:MAG: periplasmic solute binding family protein [Candidatus Xenolissoclinum pacificiensis L6]|uniref:High-affinity zinc uptake system protein ZnuA n=1 Tax=Candidatus Xenolissoclinum pacificiensis L6 TaxID=1401685 RepID=W2V226_9RICK|nr:MAG: periplasmic solute binding family protein [Candidatus Xenolissoclinum pacificiensis L6]
MFRASIILVTLFFSFKLYGITNIVVTTLPVYSVAYNIAHGGNLKIDMVSQTNDEMHGYGSEIMPSDILNLRKADLIIAIDDVLEKVYTEKTWKKKTIFLAENIPNVNDLHIWLSPEFIVKIADILLDQFILWDVENKSLYQNNYGIFLQRINIMLEDIGSMLQNIQDIKYFVLHDAYSNFTHYFSLNNPIGFLIDRNHNLVTSQQVLQLHRDNSTVCVLSGMKNSEFLFNLLPENVILFPTDILGTSYIKDNTADYKEVYFSIMYGLADAFVQCAKV